MAPNKGRFPTLISLGEAREAEREHREHRQWLGRLMKGKAGLQHSTLGGKDASDWGKLAGWGLGMQKYVCSFLMLKPQSADRIRQVGFHLRVRHSEGSHCELRLGIGVVMGSF